MSPGLADRLSAERRRRFVGRVAEKNHFRSALPAHEPPFNVLFVLSEAAYLVYQARHAKSA